MLRLACACLDQMIGRSDLDQRPSRFVLISAFFLVCLFFAVSCSWMGLAVYSPDSWAYYELSQTVLGGDFYSFNTYRSYFSKNYSAAFPLGYPVLLAVLQFFFGKTPLMALFLNGVTAVVTWMLVIGMARALRISFFSGLVLASSLVLFPPYLFEIFSGSTIPIALLFFLFSLKASLSSRFFLSGLFVGGAALFRFDYLVYALLLQVAIFVLHRERGARFFILPLGFFLGILPWLCFSESHFGKLWISDNSWVALSAYRAYVLDFPAAAAVSAADDPQRWVQRVGSNFFPLWRSLSLSAQSFPLTVLLPVVLLCCWRRLASGMLPKLALFLVLLLASVAPYLLTGYFDQRYFCLFLFCVAGVMLFAIESAARDAGLDAFHKSVVFVALVCSIIFAADYMAKQMVQAPVRISKMEQATLLIQRLSVCHAQEAALTYIFKDEYNMLAPQYGALTGKRAAFIPTNFDRLSEAERARYFSFVGPYVLIDRNLEKDQCPHSLWKTH